MSEQGFGALDPFRMTNFAFKLMGLGVMKIVERSYAAAADAQHEDLVGRRARRIIKK